ncbi:MAG TPA: M15 family metallopeptidase [Pseudochrobactrum sp.]|nr:M15 family metallopeptidase [Pseudochrobactrum sp.]
MIDNLFEESYSKFSKERADIVYNGSLDTTSALMVDGIQEGYKTGEGSESGTDYEAMWTGIMDRRQEAISRGTLPDDMDDKIVDTIILEATRTNDTELLNLLDKQLPGQSVNYSSVLKWRKKRDDAVDAIGIKQRAEVTAGDTAQKKIDKALDHKITREVAKALFSDTNTEVPEELITQWERVNPKARADIVDLRKKAAESGGVEDTSEITRLFYQIQQGGTEEDVLKAFKDGTIKTRETFNTALDRVDKFRKANQEGGILNSSQAKLFKKQFTQSLTPDKLFALLGVEAASTESLEAIMDYDLMLIQWEQENPNAGLMDRVRASEEIGNIILKRITPSNENTPTIPPQYNRPSEEKRDWEKREFEKPVERQGSLQDAGKLDKTDDPYFSNEGPPPIDRLPANQKAQLEDRAKLLGVTPEDLNGMIWEKAQRKLGNKDATAKPDIDPTTTGSVPAQVVTDIQSILRNPPQVSEYQTEGRMAPILNLIGHTEGTDKKRGYNETLGYGAYTNGDVNLVGMTLNDVDRLQSKMLRHPNNTWNSSALGRFQIVRTTLRGLREEMGLKGDEKFTPQLQDKMALHLLERRGLSKFLKGNMKEGDFINAISKEWASLPKTDGRGTYAGQRAGTSVSKVRSAIGGVLAGRSRLHLPQRHGNVPAAYAKIPAKDDRGEDQIAKFMEWNPDPVGNHESNLKSIEPSLAKVITRAQELTDVKFVLGSGKRDKAMQKKAKAWGWSKTEDSDHEHGDAADLWIVDKDGAIRFDDKASYQKVSAAMKQAAQELGRDIDWGGDWKTFKDNPHFGLKKQTARKS